MHGKASIEEQTETYADGKQKGLFAAINAITTYGNYLELLPYTLCIMTTLYTLGFKTAEQGRFGYNEVPSCTSRCNRTAQNSGMLRVRLRSSRYHTIPTRR